MNTNQLAQNIRARFSHHESRLYLKEKHSSRLTVTLQGGTWYITPEFLSCLRGAPVNMVLLDAHERPVSVNTSELLADSQHLYDDVMNQWLKEFTELEKNR